MSANEPYYRMKLESDNPLGDIPIRNCTIQVDKKGFQFEATVLLMESNRYALIKYPDYLTTQLMEQARLRDASRIRTSDFFTFRHELFDADELSNLSINERLPIPYGWVHPYRYELLMPKRNAEAAHLLRSTL